MSLYAYDAGLLKYLKEAMNFDNIINSAESTAFSVTGDESEKVEVKFPLISFWRTANPVVEGGGNFAMRRRGIMTGVDYEDSSGTRWRSLPVTLSYQLTIWSNIRKEVDDIYRELIMYLMTDNPHIEVFCQGMQKPEKFVIQVTDTDAGTDVDSFSDKGRIYTQNILIDIPEAQLLFSREVPMAKQIELRTVVVDDMSAIDKLS